MSYVLSQTPGPGFNNTGEYQISGLPWVSSSTTSTDGQATRMDFPYVSKFFSVKNNGPNILVVGFTSDGIQGNNKFTLAVSGSYSGDLRVKTLYFSGSGGSTNFELVAGLTLVPFNKAPILSSSNPGGNGVGALPNIWDYPGI